MKKTYQEFASSNVRADQADNDVTHFFSRNFVNPVAFFFYKFGLTPNQVTIIFILTGLLGGAFAI